MFEAFQLIAGALNRNAQTTRMIDAFPHVFAKNIPAHDKGIVSIDSEYKCDRYVSMSFLQTYFSSSQALLHRWFEDTDMLEVRACLWMKRDTMLSMCRHERERDHKDFHLHKIATSRHFPQMTSHKIQACNTTSRPETLF